MTGNFTAHLVANLIRAFVITEKNLKLRAEFILINHDLNLLYESGVQLFLTAHHVGPTSGSGLNFLAGKVFAFQILLDHVTLGHLGQLRVVNLSRSLEKDFNL